MQKRAERIWWDFVESAEEEDGEKISSLSKMLSQNLTWFW